MDEFREWDVNDVVARLYQRLPRLRWVTANTDFFGPDISVSALIDVPLDALRWKLGGGHEWLRVLTLKTEYGWLQSAGQTERLRVKGLLESTDGGHVVWWWLDELGRQPSMTCGDMIPPGDPLP